MSPRLAIWPADETLSSSPVIVDTADTRDRFSSFGPLEHVQALHPRNGRPGHLRHGTVSFGQRLQEPEKRKDGRLSWWREWTVDVSEAAHVAADLVERGRATDLYFSQQTFAGWRRISRLRTLGALHQDLDFGRRRCLTGKDAALVAEGVVRSLGNAGRPTPSYILHTGRGLCAVWLHDLLPRSVLPRWQACQRVLTGDLAEFGADKAALDAARVFRVAGSINRNADPLDAQVRLVWCNGSPEAPFRHAFDDLADQILPCTRAELRSLAVERASRKAAGREHSGTLATKLTVATWAETLLTDLQRLRNHRYPEGPIREGERDRWLFCAATAMAWLCPPAVLEREIAALTHEATGFNAREARGYMSSAVARAREAAAGARIEWDGEERDPRYRFKASTVTEWLEIGSAEMRAAGLRLLVDRDRRRELATERERESRRRKGMRSRADQRASLLELGRKARWLATKDGMTVREIAAEVGASPATISRAMAAVASGC